jgi:guanylate kinase
MEETRFSFNPIKREPLLIVISGPSGVGKDTVVQALQEHGHPFYFVVTATTRPIRPGEQEGVDYFFVTREEFARMIEADELLEYAYVYNDYKGIPKQQVRDALASGKDVIMRLDVQGAATIRSLCPEAVLVFLTTRTEEELIRRLEARETEDPEELNLRIAMARKELQRLDEFDYVVINAEGQKDEAVEMILKITQTEHQRVHHRKVTL